MERFKFIKNLEFNDLPKTSGVYSFYADPEKGGENPPIYIGKAGNIKIRVKNHFQQPSYRDKIFIDKVKKIGYFETNSEIEALILEAALIKKHQPKFNVMWKDDKNYFYVAFSQNEKKIPYVYITHQTTRKPATQKTRYVGPFVEGTPLKKTLRFLRKVFPHYTTSRHSKTKCTYCHLDLCPGPEPDLTLYKKNIKKLILILQGKRNDALKALKREMNQLSKENRFEEAGKVRDKIYALQYIMEHTHVINGEKPAVLLPPARNPAFILQGIADLRKPVSKIECYDISNIQGKQAVGSMVVFVDGEPDKNQYRKFKIRIKEEPDDIAMLKEVIRRRLTHKEWTLPDMILIDGGKAQLNAGIQARGEMPEIKSFAIMSLAKRNNELFVEGRKDPILLKSLPQEVFNLILRLDDEAHRFAITYHKKLRQKKLLGQ